MKLKKLLLVLPLVLTACATTPEKCDPSVDTGFLDKLGCTVSGSYDKRVNAKAAHIKELANEEKALSQEAINLSNQRAKLIEDRFARQKEMDVLQEKIDALNAKIKAQNIQDKSLQAKIDKLQKSKDAVKNLPEDVAPLEAQEKLDATEQYIDDVSDAIAGADYSL